MSDNWHEWLKPELLTALVAIAAFFFGVFEYRRRREHAELEHVRQKAQFQLELAQKLIEHFDSDEMISFAVTVLDWGGGIIVVPAAWRDVIGKPGITPSPLEVIAATQYKLTPETKKDATRLLYRHAFVRLFNHLERIEDLRASDAIRVTDLQPVTWLAQELHRWTYYPKTEWPFQGAMDGWYPKGKLKGLVEALLLKYNVKDHG
jgi:hypothetical protein